MFITSIKKKINKNQIVYSDYLQYNNFFRSIFYNKTSKAQSQYFQSNDCQVKKIKYYQFYY